MHRYFSQISWATAVHVAANGHCHQTSLIKAMFTFEFLGEHVQHKKFAWTHVNTIVICNRICAVPCKQAVQVQNLSMQKFVWTHVNVA